ncbi:MAG: DUF5050 domain-containing protein [Clostridia bacterium]|nr:DUF5050 domain-containing protein [Clostridia bacterium]
MSETSLTGLCPNCGNKLVYGKGDATVFCNACDSSVDTSMFSDKASSNGSVGGVGASSAAALSMMMGFDNPESGIVYVENYFENYDWEEYQGTTEIVISEIAEIIEKNKIKNGANGQSWYLDYKGLAIPLRKKLEGLAELEKKIGEAYNPEDNTEAYASFDTYCKILAALEKNKAAIFKQLDSDVKYAQKFSLSADKLTEMQKDLTDLKKAFDAKVREVKEIAEVPSYAAAKEELNRKKSLEFSQMGIDAASVYQSACDKLADANPNKSEALAMFESIRGYADSIEYIKKINRYFNYNFEFFRFMGKTFIFKEESIMPAALNVSKILKKDQQTDMEVQTALSLYEVVNGVPADEPIVKGIEQIITCYASRLYYFKKDKGITCYDVFSKIETALDSGKKEDYLCDGEEYDLRFLRNGSGFFFKKKLSLKEEKKGCFSFFKKAEPVERKNNFTVILVDMKSNSSRPIIPEMVDIADYYEDELFYTISAPTEKDKDKTRLMVCDVVKGTNSKILDEDCQIHNVLKGHVIYSLWKPNAYNRDLRVYNVENGQDVLIEDNILDYFCVAKDKIYYTIGNDEYCPLMRNNLDGTERMEIMRNVENIVGERAGWLYVKKGGGYNSVLVKLSGDGKTRVVICTQFKEIVEFTENYLYYLDCWDNLHIVRTDGRENRVIANDMERNTKGNDGIIINKDSICYERKELVDDDVVSRSLYKMDMQGRNVKKLVFNIARMKNFDENSLYYSKEEDLRYKVTTPSEKRNGEPTVSYATYHVKRYFVYNKNTEKSKLILTLGLPSGKVSQKGGCFGKKKTDKEIIYEPVPEVRTFKRKGLAKAGSVYAEQNGAPASTVSSVVSTVGGLFGSLKNKLTKKSASAPKAKKSSGAKGSMFGALLVVVAIMLLSMGISFLGMGASLVAVILSFVFALISAAVALACLGILPVAKLSGKKKTGILYVLLAVFMLVVGIVGAVKLPGSSKDNAIKAKETATYEDAIEVSLDSNLDRWYKYTPERSETHRIVVWNGDVETQEYDSRQLYVYVYDEEENSVGSGTNYGNPVMLQIDLEAEQTYYISISTEYDPDDKSHECNLYIIGETTAMGGDSSANDKFADASVAKTGSSSSKKNSVDIEEKGASALFSFETTSTRNATWNLVNNATTSIKVTIYDEDKEVVEEYDGVSVSSGSTLEISGLSRSSTYYVEVAYKSSTKTGSFSFNLYEA